MIALNNKAVVYLKNKDYSEAYASVMMALRLVEPRVFGLIKSGLIEDRKALFQQALQVLLHTYYNLGMCKDQQLESKSIYYRALQLYHYYGKPGHEKDLLYRKLKQKYSRSMYNMMQSTGDDRSDVRINNLPQIIPLDSDSAQGNFLAKPVTLTRPVGPTMEPDGRSVTLLGSA